jgi:hypothetical protein
MRSSSLAEELLRCWIIPAIAREKTQAIGTLTVAKTTRKDTHKKEF